MNKKCLGLLFVLLVAFTTGMFAQRATSLRINEVLITNETNFQDDYGVHSPWIEIFNTSYASVDLKGCFLTNHINFTLDPTVDNYIALYDSNGETLIDEVTIPANTLGIDQSYARVTDGGDEWEVRGENGKYVTPSTNNVTLDKNEKVENFKEHDASGIGMAITAMSVVFVALILLYLCFKLVGNLSMRLMRKKEMEAKGVTSLSEAKEQKLGRTSSEVFAAIAMALHEMQNDVHDVEETVLTISKVKRTYSPWSSKIYTLRQTPIRKR